METVKIGLFGVGLNTYWGQFEGLLDRLTGYQGRIRNKMQSYENIEVIDCGMVDDIDKANDAALLMKKEDVELLFIFVSTYALSSTLIPIVNRLNVPVILLNMQPLPAIEYDKLNSMGDRGAMTGEWLANCQACSIPEFSSVFNRGHIRYDIVSGYLDDNEAWDEISEWITAARISSGMRKNRMGVLGNYYGGMVDVYSDLTLQSMVFGTHIEVLEMCELVDIRKSVENEEIEQKIREFERTFEIDTSCPSSEIQRAAQTSVALDKLVEKHRLGSMAYYYAGMNGNEYENIITSVIAGNTLLTGKNIPIAGEYEIKNAQAMKIMALMGIGGCFSEFYAMDFNDDIVMLGHDGPAHFIISEGKVRLVPLPIYHGKPGKGLSIQMSVKHGPVTLLSVVEGNNGISLLATEGESVSGSILNIGNLNSRYKFPISAKEFIKKWSKAGSSHHCSIGIGHVTGILKKYAFILDIPITVIT
ncbi:MAG: L-fucose/L-arabinose isomerase family protein [Proteiniphilum sp.]|uniref:L-fucose/L-arabinose isomerase family protein n=1 Tax=Proteiniphilum sp. TaxID=1926877 RepID=UPI002ABCE14B|nr:L-fucose/L-arabinose isomerase family protein [Proteiniphilum sp.]MDY9918471.1 L-fucose/L-arabinose isomerase family protein [Proteiniphilum sp.]